MEQAAAALRDAVTVTGSCGWAQPRPDRPWHYYRDARMDQPSACQVWAFDPSIDALFRDPPEGARVCKRCERSLEAEQRNTQWIGPGVLIRWRATSPLHNEGPGPWRWHTAVVQQVQSCLIMPAGAPMYSFEPALSVYWARRAAAISVQVLEVAATSHDMRWVPLLNPDSPVCEWERCKPD